MGCSSSALHKTGDSGRVHSGAPSNDNFCTAEQSESCVAQPKPCTPGRESTFHGNTRRENLPLETPKVSVAPTANGVKSHHQPSLVKGVALGKDATDQSGPIKKAEPLEPWEDLEPPHPGRKDDTPETEGIKIDVEAGTEVQPLKGNAKTERSGTEAKGQHPRTAVETDSPGAGGVTDYPQAAGGMEFLGTAANILPLETAGDLPPREAMENDEQPQSLEAIPRENNATETSEGCQFVGKVEQQELQEILEKGEQSQLLETIPKENYPEISEGSRSVETSGEKQVQEMPGKDERSQVPGTVLDENTTPEVSDTSQPVQTPDTNDPLCESPGGPRNVVDSQPEDTDGDPEHPAGTAEAPANVAGETHTTDKEEQHTEGGVTDYPQAAGGMEFLGTAANILPLETAGDLPPREAMENDEQPQSLEAIPRENNATETSEGCQFVGKVEQQELQEILEKGETGEKMGAELEHRKECEGAETKEEETGESVDLSAAGDGARRASAHSML